MAVKTRALVEDIANDIFWTITDEMIKEIAKSAREITTTRCMDIARRALRDYERELERTLKFGDSYNRAKLDVIRSRADEIASVYCRGDLPEILESAIKHIIGYTDFGREQLLYWLSDIEVDIRDIVRRELG